MIALRCKRSLAISLAMLLASIELTHGFTLSYERVRPHDLSADESRTFGVRRDWKRYVEGEEEIDVAPILPLYQPEPMFTKAEIYRETETTTIGKETGKATSIYVTPVSETTRIGTTVKNDLAVNSTARTETGGKVINSTANTETAGKVVDTTPKTSIKYEGTTLMIDLMRAIKTTTVKNLLNTTTIMATNNSSHNPKPSVNEVKNTTKALASNGSTPVISTTTVSANIVKTLTNSHNTTESTTKSTVNATANPIPARKKYIEIERKPVNVTKDDVPHVTERMGDSLNAHTENRVTLEKAFDLAPDIQSLQELKTHLIDATNSVIKNDTTDNSTKSVDTLRKDQPKGKEINSTEMVSMRAGYLDHTKPAINSNISSTGNGTGVASEVEMEGVSFEMDTTDDSEDTHNKTSHSQMVEDAIKEELLEEARLVDSIRFHTSDQPKNAEQNEIIASSDIKQGTNKSRPDDLTVKPINHEARTLNLYTVSPNYKPRKKIDVQPMKPFMRDPDDNSWRNESLSSLGIVFKGKNSSKAFTEVLKNKTETVMSSLLEQEKAMEKVELRDKLEKLAEKRKSKKKKTNKFGDTEYTDYEENNSGDVHSSTAKPNNNPEPLLTSTAPPVSTKIVEWVAKGSGLYEEIPDTDADKKANTKKPKTIPHYEDSKEEDGEYGMIPNIDILKSTPRPRVQWPVTQKILDNSEPNRQYVPERLPTVQYFPPLPKPLIKVLHESVNYKDDSATDQFNTYRHTRPTNVEHTDTYTDKSTEKYPGVIRNRVPVEDKNQQIQHVEYRPTEETDNFVVRQYKDLLEQVIKDVAYDRNAPYGVPSSVISDEAKTVKSEEYNYGERKEQLNRFLDNFNQNHARFKLDFPVVFNTSIVHGSESGKVLASSSAMYKRLYNAGTQGESFAFSKGPYDPNCENVTVELAPAYELHYYIPEQEETADHTMSYG